MLELTDFNKEPNKAGIIPTMRDSRSPAKGLNGTPGFINPKIPKSIDSLETENTKHTRNLATRKVVINFKKKEQLFNSKVLG